MSDLFEPKRVTVEKTETHLFIKKFGNIITVEPGEIYSMLNDILDSCDSHFLYSAIKTVCEQGLKNDPKHE